MRTCYYDHICNSPPPHKKSGQIQRIGGVGGEGGGGCCFGCQLEVKIALEGVIMCVPLHPLKVMGDINREDFRSGKCFTGAVSSDTGDATRPMYLGDGVHASSSVCSCKVHYQQQQEVHLLPWHSWWSPWATGKPHDLVDMM